MVASPVYTSSVYISAAPQTVWEWITQPNHTQLWYFNSEVESRWEANAPIVYRRAGTPLFEGIILDIEVPSLLVTTFSPLFDPRAREEEPSRMTWKLKAVDDDVRLSVTFDNIQEGSATDALVKDGMAYPLHILKALVETGRRPPVGNVTCDCVEPARLATFWAEVTGYVIDGAGETWAGLHDPRGVGPRLLFFRVPEPKVGKNRVHLDINVVDREGEAQRLVALGAQRLHDVSDYGLSWIVMADPEGNEFCIA